MKWNSVIYGTKKPNNGERYLIYDSLYHCVKIATFDLINECWEEEHTNRTYDFDRAEYWIEIPKFKK